MRWIYPALFTCMPYCFMQMDQKMVIKNTVGSEESIKPEIKRWALFGKVAFEGILS